MFVCEIVWWNSFEGKIIALFLSLATLSPVLLNSVGNNVFHGAIDATIISSIEQVIFGLLMIIFMIYEPLGMAKLWENLKQKFSSKFSASNVKNLKSSLSKKS